LSVLIGVGIFLRRARFEDRFGLSMISQSGGPSQKECRFDPDHPHHEKSAIKRYVGLRVN
jgi:hypothetical protein